jgi:hypothetical protein
MGKWDFNLEDLLMVVNFFSKVTVDEHGLLPSTAVRRRPAAMLNCLRRWTCWWCSPRCNIRWTPPEYAPRPVQLSWRQAADEEAAIRRC